MPDADPQISLIVSTKGRHQQIDHLLQSLEGQEMRAFEVIIVEQNKRRLIADTLAKPWSFSINYLHTPDEQGCSRGRNRGLALARGEYVLFPDDDCWYPPAFLRAGLDQIAARGVDVLTGRPTDEQGNTIDGRYEAKPQAIVRGNVWTTMIEWMAIFRREVLVELGGFDEDVGVGALTPWQSAEGQDLVLRALASGATGWYDPALNGHDAGTDRDNADDELIARARKYGRGMGWVMRKHRIGPATPVYFLVRATGGAVLNALRVRTRLARFHGATAIGRLEGLIGRSLKDLG